jgi:hypothetical protein
MPTIQRPFLSTIHVRVCVGNDGRIEFACGVPCTNFNLGPTGCRHSGDGSASRIKAAAVRNKAISLRNTPALCAAGKAAVADLSVETWVKEGRELAERKANTQAILEHLDGQNDRKKLPPLDRDEDYLKDGGAVAQKRLVEAGLRLAALLKTIAGD